MSQSILISRCNNTTIIVKGKANAVTIENTQRVSLVVDSLVSTVDVVKSSNFALQVLGSLIASSPCLIPARARDSTYLGG